MSWATLLIYIDKYAILYIYALTDIALVSLVSNFRHKNINLSLK